MNPEEIKVGRTYRAKRRTMLRAGPNDRRVLWINDERTCVQYDSAAVHDGMRYPTVQMADFAKWAHAEVESPEFDW